MSTILVVDDHAEVRKSTVRLLASHGYDAVAVAGGREALLYVQTHTPRLVLLDLNMRELDGLTVLRDLRAQPGLASLPVVLLTAGEENDAARSDAAALAVQDWIVKVSDGWVERVLEAAQRYATPRM
jgi:CheY-like chemotaxis protein